MNLEQFYEKKARRDSAQLPKPRNVRAKSKGETEQFYRRSSTHHCIHGRSYYSVCNAPSCRRNEREANDNLSRFLSKS